MRRSFKAGIKWTHQLHKTPCRTFSTLPIEAAAGREVDIHTFQRRAFILQKPFLFRNDAASPTHSLPAFKKWFTEDSFAISASLSSYMQSFQEWPFPYELVRPSGAGRDTIISFRDWLLTHEDRALAATIDPTLEGLHGNLAFFQLYAPLRLLIKALEFNRSQKSQESEPIQLYIAQSLLTDLPQALQEDVPPPELVHKAGKGDVYSSSIWLGIEPTYTPLHRDPNPNLFCQLCSSKVVRLLPPAPGSRLFFDVQAQIRQHGSSRIRTTEMMEGKEREVLHDAVWQSSSLLEELYEAELGPGDSLFIPKGWWHSVKSKGSEGKLNGSANWWFR